ncbi:tRNA pseudouridine synthase TruB [Psychroflexus torquis ATCC 700755]|uniref:tRNA pseudouridine synthase B n=1 Tax=Psychroflexus torquis (strain ATCC 700755 / CIP 106069 / ACAM 623) TaxID=313595 RepID=K4IIU6_PSYTT|nr:tRNA pseudouridine(55) synthase TruB [Psychroflexus torquis]AFU69006.1 tRNA pseudouridine synthase TruB [Psychroflexus torquis ATCC 700755]
MDNLTLDGIKEGQILLFDKPLHWTSFQVVNKVRWLIKQKFDLKKLKVGHAGTLDPLATGLVILCTGKATKTIESLMGQTKIYTGEFTVGATTPSYDMETEVDKTFETSHITTELIQNTLPQFRGEIMQRPPIFSALKKEGKRLYEYARKGESVDIPKRQVNIDSFDIIQNNFPKLNFKIQCSKGTYIRSLAYDFGEALNSGAYLSELRRTQIGDYNVKKALSIEDFEKLIED